MTTTSTAAIPVSRRDHPHWPPRRLAQTRTAFASAAKDALAALERIVDLHGTKGMAVSHPVQRFWRDASVGACHVLLNQFMIEEEYGKLLAGPLPT